jgi:hypothetical protein
LIVANRITTIIDFITDSAQRSVKTFRTAVSEAEGAAGKFKAGASSALATVSANAGSLALAGGAALVTFGAKAVGAFTDGALAAGKFSDASGLAVEDASRWQEVAGDLGGDAEKFATAFVKMEKAIATNGPAVKELGIEVIRTDDGLADMNATMLDAIDRLGGIKDPTDRAKAATELFGRGFADMAEIVLGDADEIKKRLEEVSGAQVFDADEVEKARRFRDAMDNLRDSAEQIMLVVGEALVPALSDAAEQVTDLTEGVNELKSAFDSIPAVPKAVELWFKYLSPRAMLVDNTTKLYKAVGNLGKNLFGLGDDGRKATLAVEALDDALDPIIDSIAEAADKATLLDGALSPLTESILAAVEAEQRQAESATANATAADLYVESLGMLPAALERAQDATIEQIETDAIYRQQARDIADEMESKGIRVLEEKAAADDRAAEAAQRHREQIDLVVDALDRQRDAAVQLIGGDIAVRETQRRAAEEVEELNAVLADQETTLGEAGAAIDEAVDAQLRAAQSAADYKEQQAKANGITVDSKEEARLYKQELELLVAQLDGPIAAALQVYIDQLNAIPKTIGTTLILNTPGRVGDFAAPEVGGQFALNGAAGAPVINVNVTTTGEVAPSKIVDAIDKYYRFNAPR